MNPATPLFLRYTPSCLPIRESISTIVWICRGWWQCWHHWWQDWHEWRRSGITPTMVDPATPGFLISCPGVFCVHSAIEWVHRTRRYWACGWRCVWCCGRWRGRWCGWRSGWRSWWKRHWWLWQSRGRSRRGTTPAHGAAAEVLLGLGPCCFPHRESTVTIVRE